MKKTAKKVSESKHVVRIKRPLLYLTLTLLIFTAGVTIGGWSVFRQIDTDSPYKYALATTEAVQDSMQLAFVDPKDSRQYIPELRISVPYQYGTQLLYRISGATQNTAIITSQQTSTQTKNAFVYLPTSEKVLEAREKLVGCHDLFVVTMSDDTNEQGLYTDSAYMEVMEKKLADERTFRLFKLEDDSYCWTRQSADHIEEVQALLQTIESY